MKILSCRTLSCRQNHVPGSQIPRLVYRETPPQTPKSGTQKPKNAKSPSKKEQTLHPNAARIKQIREGVKKAKAEMPEDVLSTRLEKGHDEEASFKQYPKGEKLKTDVQRAEIRKRVSKILFEQDKTLAPKEQQEFKTSEDVKKLEKDYRSEYETKLAEEKEDFFSKKHVKFGDLEIAEDMIGLDKSVLEVLNVNIGDKVKVGGHELEVVEMHPEVKKLGKRVLINKQYEQDVGDKIVIEVSERKQKTADDEAKNAQEESKKHDESQPQKESFWTKAGKRLRFFGSLMVDGIKDVAKGVKSFFGF